MATARPSVCPNAAEVTVPTTRPSRRIGSSPHGSAAASSSTKVSSRLVRVRSRCSSSASRPRNGAGLSSRTAKPSPASQGVSSMVTSRPHARYAFSMRRESSA